MITIILFILFMAVFAYAVCWVAGEADKHTVIATCKCGARATGPLILADGVDVERHSAALCEDCPNCRAVAENGRHNRIAAATGNGHSVREITLYSREWMPCS